MFSPDDTIVAIATPPGRGGIGVVRISGPSSDDIARAVLNRSEPLQSRHATFARMRDTDEVIATRFASPRSYTGQDVVEISAHGNPVVLRAIVDAAILAGARLAEPGEFTLRAFLNGRLDLVQAEAVADLIDAVTPLQARTAFDQLEGTLTRRIGAIEHSLFELAARLEASLDFPDEGYHFIEPADVRDALCAAIASVDALLVDARRGRTIREGATVVIAGRPNVGKSSLFNKLAGHDRAIVTDVPGTTRDLVSERVDVSGVPITLVDTAGLRTSDDIVERQGVERARSAADVATLLIVVLDQSEPLRDDDQRILSGSKKQDRIIVRNKTDLPPAWREDDVDENTITVSVATGSGLNELRAVMTEHLTGAESLRDAPAISNMRHIDLLERTREHLARAADAAHEGVRMPEEFLLTDLQQARAALEEITGERTTDDLLNHIFERFCIGK